MSQDALAVRTSNPLALPLLIVSIVAVGEAIALIFVVAALARRPEPAPAGSAQAPSNSSAQDPLAVKGGKQPPTDAATQNAADRPGFALGEPGQRVESGGFAITVEKINHEPEYKNLADWSDEYRYLALLIAVENNSGGNADLLPGTFRLQDDRGYPHQQLGVKLTEPKLAITVLGHGEKVRGYLDFVVPKTAKGLKLIYSGVPTRNSQPIHVDLGE